MGTTNIKDLHFREMGRTPLLEAEEEVTLVRYVEAGRMAQEELNRNGLDPEKRTELESIIKHGLAARERLVLANTRLVISIARRYMGRGMEFLDLIQEGHIGLIRAADKFDYRVGSRFSTYATWWIRQAITRAIAEQSRIIRVPVYLAEQISKMLWASHRLTQELGRKPDTEELAAALEMSPAKMEDLLQAALPTLSLDMPIGDEQENEWGDLIQDEDSLILDEQVDRSILHELLGDILQDLPPREARVLRLRYGLVNGKTYTLQEIGEKLGITRERVRQIETQALNRLRHPVRSRRLRDFLVQE